jgi:hypothetical protein
MHKVRISDKTGKKDGTATSLNKLTTNIPTETHLCISTISCAIDTINMADFIIIQITGRDNRVAGLAKREKHCHLMKLLRMFRTKTFILFKCEEA